MLIASKRASGPQRFGESQFETPRPKIKHIRSARRETGARVKTRKNHCITHHLGDLKTSDDVIYLDAGHIVEQGSFEELMAAKGTFYQQVNARGEDE